ncbi:MAG TPA: hypothetical protein VGL18_09820 [Actinomycetota bacterium]
MVVTFRTDKSFLRCYFRLMTGVVWTAIALLGATLFGSLYYLGSKIDSLGARLDSRIDGLAGRIDGLVNRIDTLADRLDSRLDVLANRIDTHLERHAG